jgi:hypothetical protein
MTTTTQILFWYAISVITGLVFVGLAATATTTAAQAQQQAPESDKSQGQGQGPPFNRGICITTGNLNPTVEPKSEQAREVCDQGGQVSNSGQCMQILREAEAAGESSPFGSAIDTNEECKEAFPYSAPNSQNPND